MVDFGSDVGCYPDLDPSFATVTALSVLGQDLARRLETPRGGLFYDSQYGTDVREMVNDSITLTNSQKRQTEIASEVLKDERVRRVTVTINYSPDASVLIKLMVETAAGPFTFILNVTAITVSLLKVG
jgi:phage baseplate assembly protein W